MWVEVLRFKGGIYSCHSVEWSRTIFAEKRDVNAPFLAAFVLREVRLLAFRLLRFYSALLAQ